MSNYLPPQDNMAGQAPNPFSKPETINQKEARLAKKEAELQTYEKSLRYEYENKIKELSNAGFRTPDGTVNVLTVPIIICSECLSQYENTVLPDHLRIRFRHGNNRDGCSMSMIEIIRPLAIFNLAL